MSYGRTDRVIDGTYRFLAKIWGKKESTFNIIVIRHTSEYEIREDFQEFRSLYF